MRLIGDNLMKVSAVVLTGSDSRELRGKELYCSRISIILLRLLSYPLDI